MSDQPQRPKGKGGRPRSPNARTGQVMVRLSPAERAHLEEVAGAGHIAEYLRAAGLRQQPRIPRAVPAINGEAWRELAAVAGNLNQLARAANEGRVLPAGDVLPVIEDLRRRVADLRVVLIGGEGEDDGDREADQG